MAGYRPCGSTRAFLTPGSFRDFDLVIRLDAKL